MVTSELQHINFDSHLTLILAILAILMGNKSPYFSWLNQLNTFPIFSTWKNHTAPWSKQRDKHRSLHQSNERSHLRATWRARLKSESFWGRFSRGFFYWPHGMWWISWWVYGEFMMVWWWFDGGLMALSGDFMVILRWFDGSPVAISSHW